MLKERFLEFVKRGEGESYISSTSMGGSSIKINSIYIDLAAGGNGNDEIGKGRCEHFSIRGYVSEIRKKDRKKCCPFFLNGDCKDENCILPPLSVPKSRWWCCEGCLHEIGSDRNASVKLKKDGCRFTGSCSVGNNSQIIIRLEDASERHKGKITTSKKVREIENGGVMNGRITEVATDIGPSDIAGVVDDTPEGVKNHKSDHLSMQSDECENVSSESAVLMRRRVNDHNPNSFTGFRRRKTRKSRLLSELLGKTDAKTSSSRRELVKGRKRKLAEDEEWRPPNLNPQNVYASRRVMKMGKSSGRTIQSSDSKDSSVSWTGSQTSEESGSTDNEFDKDPIKDMKKNRMFQEVDEHLLEASEKNWQKGVGENDEDSDKVDADDSTLVRSVSSAFTGRELLPFPRHAQTADGKSFLAKKKNKKSRIHYQKNPAISPSNDTLEKNSSEMRKMELMRSDLRNSAVQNVSKGKGLKSSLGNFLAPERYAKSQLEDRVLITSSWEELPLKKDHSRPKNAVGTNCQDLGLTSTCEKDAYTGTGFYADRTKNDNPCTMSCVNQKLNHSSATEARDSSITQQRETSNAQEKGKTVVIQDHTSRSHGDHNPEKSPEHLDDIPMEIVELMAKNQYERCLPDGEGNHSGQLSQSTSTSKNTLLIDLNKTYENGLTQEGSNNNTSRKPNSHCTSTRKMGENLVTAPEKSIDFSQVNQFGQAFLPGLGIPPQNREYPASAIQFSGIGSTGHASTSKDWGWFRNMAKANGQNPSSSAFRELKPCNTCQSVPHHPKGPSDNLLQPIIPPNHLPVSHNIPQKDVDNSTKLGVLSQTPNNHLNSWTLNFQNPRNKSHGFGSEYAFGCKHSGTNRSVDQYHNESSIPAMHLLSLMDPRLRSNTLTDSMGNGRFQRSPAFCQVHHSKELVGLQPGESNKTSEILKDSLFDFYSKRLSTEASRETFASIPVGPSMYSLQSGRSSSKCGVSVAQTSMKHQEKTGKSKAKCSPLSNSQRNVFSSGDLRKFRFPGASAATMLPLNLHMAENARKQKGKTQSQSAAPWPSKGVPESIICGVNRNPADFSIAEPGNPYMIKGKDLKFRKGLGLRKNTGLNGGKKQSKKFFVNARENI